MGKTKNKINNSTPDLKNHNSSPQNIISYLGYTIPKKYLSTGELEELKKNLTVSPKDNGYTKNIPKYKLYKESTNNICIPRYYGEKLFSKGLVKKSTNNTNKNIIEFYGKMRPNQVPIVNTCLKHIEECGGGILNIPCGYGKTLCSIYMYSQLTQKYKQGLKLMVVAGKEFLLTQWENSLKEFTNATIGIMQANKLDTDKDVVLATIQSLCSKDYSKDILKQFDMVVYDECHHCPAAQFCKAMQKTNFKYTIGLSATFDRTDGLIKVCNWFLGDIMYSIEREPDNSVIIKTIDYISNNQDYKEQTQWVRGKTVPSSVKMLTSLAALECRNTLLTDILIHLLMNHDRKILVLSGRLAQLDLLKKIVDAAIVSNRYKLLLNRTTSKYVGGMKRTKLDVSAKANLIFATYDMASEGLDIGELNTLVLALPKKNIVQSIGRILRKKTQIGKPAPLVIDIWDNLSIFKNWSTMRERYYNKNQHKCLNFHAFNDHMVSIKQFLLDIYDVELKKEITIEALRDEYIEHLYGNNLLRKQKKNKYDLFPLCMFEDDFNVKNMVETMDFKLVDKNNEIVDDDDELSEEDIAFELRQKLFKN